MITLKQYRKLQYKAKQLVNRAKLQGNLPSITELTTCFYCGNKASGYDHRDYEKPLDVKPVCKKCNFTLPPALPLYKKPIVDGGRMLKKDDVLAILSNKEMCQILKVNDSTGTRMNQIVPVKHRKRLVNACQKKAKKINEAISRINKDMLIDDK